MRRWIFRLFIILSICIGLLAVFADAILDQVVLGYKDEIESALGEKLGAKVSANALSVRLFPIPHLSASDLTIDGLGGTSEPLKVSQLTLNPEIWPLFERKLILRKLSARIPSFNIQENDRRLNVRDVELSSKLKLEQNRFGLSSLKIDLMLNERPLSFSADEVVYDPATSELSFSNLSLNQLKKIASVNTTSGELNVSGSIALTDRKVDLNLRATSLQLASVSELAAKLSRVSLGAFSSGELSGAATCVGSLAETLQIKADLKISDLTSKKSIALESASINGLELIIEKGILASAGSNIKLTNLAITGGDDRYQTAKVNAEIKLARRKAQELELRGDLDLVEFGFSDKVTTITDSDAKIRPVITFHRTGAISASFELNGTRHKLKHEAIEIDSIKHVRANLALSIPNGPGYKLSGPITVMGGKVRTIGHLFQNTSGTVELLISEPEKRFVSKDISFVDGENKARLAANFQMTPQRFELVTAETDRLGGTVNLKATMVRQAKRTFSIDATAKQLELAKIMRFIEPDKASELQGIVDLKTLSVSGDRNAFLPSLTGTAEFNGRQAIASPHGIGAKILGALRSAPVVGSIFGSDTTEFERESQTFNAKLQLQDSKIYFESAKLSRPTYNVNLTGTVGFDKQMDIKGDVIILEESAAMLELNITPLKNLFGRIGRISVPVSIRGLLPDVSVEVDIETFLKNYSGISLGQRIFGDKKKRVEPRPSPTP